MSVLAVDVPSEAVSACIAGGPAEDVFGSPSQLAQKYSEELVGERINGTLLHF